MENGPKHDFGLSKRFCLILTSILLTIAITLGVGLGVGLTRDRGSNDSNNDSSSPPSTLPTSNSTNTTTGTFWRPVAGTTWQIVLQYPLNDTSPNVTVFDIDLFTNNASMISTLHSLNRKVICYFSAGSYEDFRPDSHLFSKTDYGKPLQGWSGEWWLNTTSENVRGIMRARLDMAREKGCDGVDPDNVDGYDNDTGFQLTPQDGVEYMAFLAEEAHARGLAIGLKNAGGIVNATLPMMQWQVNEQCVQYQECDLFRPFIDADKPVFHIEYPKSAPKISGTDEKTFCDEGAAGTDGFSTLLKNMDLDDWFQTC